MYNHKLETTDNVKFLGIIIDNHIKFNLHYDKIMKACNFNKHRIMSLKTNNCKLKTNLYKIFVRPHIEYGCTAMTLFPKEFIKKLDILQNNCLRHARIGLDNHSLSNIELRTLSKVDDLNTRILQLSRKWYDIAIVNNIDIKEFVERHPVDASTCTPWNKILAFSAN